MSADILAVLQSIDASLKALVTLSQARQKKAAANDDKLCDGPHGDPIIKAKSPRDWTGDDMTGRHFSECPPDYLDLLADRFDYFASKETDDKKQKYNLLDARRARAWAARIRGGWTAPVSSEPQTTGEPQW